MKLFLYKYRKFAFFIFFILIPLLCFAAKDNKDYLFNRTIDSLIEFFIGCIFYSPFILALAFIFGSLAYIFIAPIVLRAKIKDYCQKHNLKFIRETKKLPYNYLFKFIHFNCDYKFTDLMVGERSGISFILGDCHFGCTSGSASAYRYFTFLLFKSSNSNFPYFFLRKEIDLDKFKRPQYIINGKHSSIENKFSKSISFYESEYLLIDEDNEFTEELKPIVDDIDSSYNFFNENRRKLFLKNSQIDTVYEGYKNTLVIARTTKIDSFKERMKLFESSLSLFVNIDK